MSTAASQASVVSGNLLTSTAVTTPWQNCDGSDLIGDAADAFDPSHLDGAGCVFRETAAEPQQQYKLTCGVSSLKYASMTLSFLNDDGTTLAEETTEIFENVQGGAYSATLMAPAGTTTAAIGIYGLHGTGFQDCTLLLDNPVVIPVDGSISGLVWFDEDGDATKAATESVIASSPVSLFLNDVLVSEMVTDLDGSYYFGGLDVDQCYTLKFDAADPTLTFTSSGGDNAADSTGATAPICLTDATPNVADILAGFVTIPPVIPPQDYAVCGMAFLQGASGKRIANVDVKLINVVTNEQLTTTTGTTGAYSFSSLPAGDYKLMFGIPSAYSYIDASSDLTATTSFADDTGMSPQFNLPNNSNTAADDACTISNANVGYLVTPVALEPTIATDDEVSGIVGELLSISILDNDIPCGGSALAVDVMGHNVPGDVSYNADNGTFVISNTTASGTYSIEYGLRGACGSYDTATVTVVIDDAPVVPVQGAPDAPHKCRASIGKVGGDISKLHIDLFFPDGVDPTTAALADYFAPEYNFYDANMDLIFTGLRDPGDPMSAKQWRQLLFWRHREHGTDVINVPNIRFVTAVENGLESPKTDCIQQTVTPIALDTDHSGRIDAIYGQFDFDLNGDGIDETLTEWFSPTDGILITKDFGDAISGEHLFGDTGGKYADGFKKLATKDLNGDGKLMAEELGSLAIWTDRNSNQSVDDGEISSLQTHSIQSLSVEHYKYTARATLENGKTLMIRDLWFGLRSIEQAAK